MYRIIIFKQQLMADVKQLASDTIDTEINKLQCKPFDGEAIRIRYMTNQQPRASLILLSTNNIPSVNTASSFHLPDSY